MSEATAKSGLEGAAREWAEQNADELPPPPAATPNANAPGSTATPSSPPPPTAAAAPAASDDDDDDDEEESKPITPEEAAALFVGVLDFALTVFVSPKLEFKERQERKLTKLAVPLAKKYLPDTEDVVSPEMAFVVGLGAICWKNYTSSPEPANSPASPGGGSEGTNGSSGGPSKTTEASVDGRPVTAQVLQ